MKIAISGKGGVGKSTISAALALLLARRGERVLALDADPDANLAHALGASAETRAQIVPIAKQIALIEERTGAKIDEYGKVFKLNPEVSDVADTYATRVNGVDLLTLGGASRGGGGCACPENAFLKALVTDLVLYKNETLIMDMEAGVEHLGRATASGVDVMVVVAEPGQRAADCAASVTRMAKEIGIRRFVYVASKVASASDEAFVRAQLPEPPAACVPFSEAIRAADRDGVSVLNYADAALLETFDTVLKACLAV